MTFFRSTRRERLRGAVTLALFSFLTAAPAHGHATLLQTNPPANSRLEQAPRQVMLSFDERVETIFNSVEVLDEKGNRVDDGRLRLSDQDDVLSVNLKPVSKGQYVVSWKVVSLDSHQVEGYFGFGIGEPAPTDAEMTGLIHNRGSSQSTLFTAIVKWFGLAAMTVWLGGIGFWIWAFTPSRKLLEPKTSQSAVLIRNAQARICRIIWISAAIFAAAQCLALMEQAAVFSGLSFVSALSPLTLWTVITKTNYGEWWGVRMAAFMALAGVSRPYFSSGIRRTETSRPATKTSFLAACWVILGGLILLSLPLTGHARAVPHAPVLAIASDWAHLAATAVWIGGLVFLLAVTSIRGSEEEQQFLFLTELLGRFSRLAQICVATLILTGVYAAWLHIPHWNSFLTTPYGRTLTVKILLIIPMLLIGFVNWQRVLPALARFVKEPPPAMRWRERLPTLLRFESFLGVSILLAVAFLTGLPPATAVTMGGPVNLSQTNGDAGIKVNLSLDSAQTGTRHAVVTLADSSGHRAGDAQKVTLYLAMQDMDMGLETLQTKRFPDGSYRADLPLTMAGKWKVSVEVTPARGDAFVTEFELTSGF